MKNLKKNSDANNISIVEAIRSFSNLFGNSDASISWLEEMSGNVSGLSKILNLSKKQKKLLEEITGVSGSIFDSKKKLLNDSILHSPTFVPKGGVSLRGKEQNFPIVPAGFYKPNDTVRGWQREGHLYNFLNNVLAGPDVITGFNTPRTLTEDVFNSEHEKNQAEYNSLFNALPGFKSFHDMHREAKARAYDAIQHDDSRYYQRASFANSERAKALKQEAADYILSIKDPSRYRDKVGKERWGSEWSKVKRVEDEKKRRENGYIHAIDDNEASTKTNTKALNWLTKGVFGLRGIGIAGMAIQAQKSLMDESISSGKEVVQWGQFHSANPNVDKQWYEKQLSRARESMLNRSEFQNLVASNNGLIQRSKLGLISNSEWSKFGMLGLDIGTDSVEELDRRIAQAYKMNGTLMAKTLLGHDDRTADYYARYHSFTKDRKRRMARKEQEYDDITTEELAEGNYLSWMMGKAMKYPSLWTDSFFNESDSRIEAERQKAISEFEKANSGENSFDAQLRRGIESGAVEVIIKEVNVDAPIDAVGMDAQEISNKFTSIVGKKLREEIASEILSACETMEFVS